MTKKNNLQKYLAVSAGTGCAMSVANAAIIRIDLDGLVIAQSTSFRIPGLDSVDDLFLGTSGTYGEINSPINGFYGATGSGGGRGLYSYGRGYQSGPAAFPTTGRGTFATWSDTGIPTSDGFAIGENFVAFRESSGVFGWLSFTLSSLGPTNSNPLESFNWFSYNDASTGPGNALTLDQAISGIPEPSSLALLALGSTGLLLRRRREASKNQK